MFQKHMPPLCLPASLVLFMVAVTPTQTLLLRDNLRHDRSMPEVIEPTNDKGIIATLDDDALDPTHSLDYYDKLRFDSDVDTLTNATSQIVGVGPYRLCNLASFLALSSVRDNSTRPHSTDEAGAVLLAVHHFNNGIHRVVPQLENLPSKCDVRLTADLFDTRQSPLEAVRILVSDSVLGRDHSATTPHPCGLIGAWRSAVSIPLATVSVVAGHGEGIPIISHSATSTELDNTDKYPLFGRTLSSSAGDAHVGVDYLKSVLNVTHLGMVYVKEAWGIAYAKAFRNAAIKRGVRVQTVSISYEDFTAEEARSAMGKLSRTNFRYFLGIIYNSHFNTLMLEAYKAGLAGRGDTFWIFGDLDQKVFGEEAKYLPSDPLAKAANGIAFLRARGGLPNTPGRGGYDKFLAEWSDMNDDRIKDYVRSKLPSNLLNVSGYDPNFAFSDVPGQYPLFVYDATIAYGLAACNVASGRSNNKYGHFFSSGELFNSYQSNSFDGASGPIRIDPKSGSRDVHSELFTIDNAVANIPTGDSDRFVTYSIGATSMYTDGQWLAVPGADAFVYNDGTTTPPPVLPVLVEDTNQIESVRAVGLTLCAFNCLIAIIALIWTVRNRRSRVVKASQPLFLNMVYVGAFIMACAIIPLSFDDSNASQRGLDIACMAPWWCVSIGFSVSFSALFAKTWRVNRVFHAPAMTRVKVQVKDVLLPFVIFLSLNLLILIIWTAVAPLEYARFYSGSKDEFGRPLESYGMCTFPDDGCRSTSIALLVLLVVIDFAVLVFANFQAYQARNIATDYSESEFIAIIMASILQAWVLGLPLFGLVYTEPTARFLVISGIIFITCLAIVLLMFVPKVYYGREMKLRDKARMEANRKKRLGWERQALRSSLTLPFPPESDSHELDFPELDSPELDLQELESPELDSPESDTMTVSKKEFRRILTADKQLCRQQEQRHLHFPLSEPVDV